MKKTCLIFICCFFTVQFLSAQVKILFDATKAETAANADWVIDSGVFDLGYPATGNPGGAGAPLVGGGNESDPQRFPSPSKTLGQSYPESDWKGALSYWGLDCIQKGYSVETLPVGGSITYGNSLNAQDLSNYKAFVVCEPNIQFTSAEKTAILTFVQNGGGLFMISDHDVSDRNNDGWDSPGIWDDLMQVNSTGNTNPFGMIFNRGGSASTDNFSQTSSNVNQSLAINDSILHGPMGNVTTVKWSNGTSITLSPAANPSVKAVIYSTAIASPPSGNNQVMVAYARYGNGKVIAIGDSSPCDDGTGDTNDALFPGYMGDVPPNHRNLLMNGTIWLVTAPGPLPLSLTSFTAAIKLKAVQLTWTSENEQNVLGYQVQHSVDGSNFDNTGNMVVAINNGLPQSYLFTDNDPFLIADNYYRLKMIDKDGSYKFSDIRILRSGKKIITAWLENNPVEKEIQLHISSPNTTTLFVKISNMAGQVISQRKIRLVNGIQKTSFNIDYLSSGIYNLTLSNDNFIQTIRFVKKL